MLEENNRIAELGQKIESIRDRALRSKKPLSEGTVILARVMPILNILGWDSEDSNAVVREFPVKGFKDKWADIALGENMEEPYGRVHVFIEAKASREPLSEKYASQLEDYCLKQRVRLGVLTNGLEWAFYLYPKDEKNPILAAEIDIRQDTVDSASKTFDHILSHKRVSDKEQHLQYASKAAFRKLSDQVWEAMLKDREDIRSLVQRNLSKKRGKQVVKEEKKWLEEWLGDKIMELHSATSEAKSRESGSPSTSGPEAKSEPKPTAVAQSGITHIVAFGKQIKVKSFREARIVFLQELEVKCPGSLEQLSEQPHPDCLTDSARKGRSGRMKQIGSLPYWATTNHNAVKHWELCRKALEFLGLPSGSVQFFSSDDEYKG